MVPEYLIKFIIGIAVVVTVLTGFYFFGSYIIDFFKGLGGNEETPKIVLSLIR